MEEEVSQDFFAQIFQSLSLVQPPPSPTFSLIFFCLFPWNHRCDCLAHTESKMEEEAFLNFLHSNSSVSLTRISLILI